MSCLCILSPNKDDLTIIQLVYVYVCYAIHKRVDSRALNIKGWVKPLLHFLRTIQLGPTLCLYYVLCEQLRTIVHCVVRLFYDCPKLRT